MHVVIVIDDNGAELDLDDPALPAPLGASRQNPLRDYLVLNLGYVACEIGRRSLRIRLRFDIVSQRALAALAKRLLSHPLDRVVLSTFDGKWSDELLPSAELALQRLADLMIKTHHQRVANFQFQEIDEQKLPRASPVAAVLAYWKSANTHFEVERISPLLHRGFEQRFLMMEHLPDNDQLIIRSLGQGYTIFDKTWCAVAAGERFEDQYDVYYAQWAAQGYRRASARTAPVMQRIDAVIDNPRTGYRRQRYARIIVPYRRDGHRLLLSASTTNLAMVSHD